MGTRTYKEWPGNGRFGHLSRRGTAEPLSCLEPSKRDNPEGGQ
jgi:hypothetical protein